MNKIKLVALSCSLSISTFSYSVTTIQATEPNLSQNVSKIIYHSSQLPKVIYENGEIVNKLLRGEVVNPSQGLLGTLFSGATSVLNGDMTKLIKLSRDLGPHIKAIEDNSLAIKTSTKQSLPNTFVNLLETAPKEILKTANSALKYAADSTITKSSDYQETKKKIAENSETVLEQKRQLDTVKQTSQQNKKTAEKMQKELLVVKKNAEEKLEQQNTLLLATIHQVEKNVTDVDATHKKVSQLQQQYHQLQTSIEENRALSSRGIASIAAMANIPVPALVGKTTIGAGVGRFDTKNAVAVGVSRYYENGVAVKVSLGTAGAKVTLGGGVSYSF
ncbi:YadA C-terminal domain-containing protein [Pasteurella multocida]|uniref:YadA C-terminal domain-containing protein n=1 Tax=Pasteurella multocida TaxID=747 RepID=UPI000E04ECBA|nr:YadA C-terminal domain-containing protein [Pasteurella multocida]MCL7786384.1 YadA C-terminal domain-containing protein [Pasteurella multocida]MCL7795684.1 YadA C-terminal domain-containing protein [Pasteurella multocida]URI02750.1 YadA C-terminal domain-containing protein [Pasteurella multocida]WRK09442.1 YadA C-terminal domain-containing protein [Pasteurella multocida]SUB46395.1 putative autotransporter YadA-like, C-terminal domain protein [Pasteurella multocida subsp. septica]